MQRILQISALELRQSSKQARLRQLEHFQSWKDHMPKYISRHKGYDPDKTNVVAVIGRPEVSPSGVEDLIKEWYYGPNIVTNDGDIYYAQKAVGETPATNENFLAGRYELQNPATQDTPAKTDTYGNVTTPITASRKVYDSTYPKRNDNDTDNTGAGVDIVTYRTSWTTGDFTANGINGGAIHDNASPVAGTKLLTHFTISSFNKTSSDTLKFFVNHTMNGV